MIRPNSNIHGQKIVEVILLRSLYTRQCVESMLGVGRYRYARWLMKIFTSAYIVQTVKPLVRNTQFELKHFGTLALHCPLAERDWAMQASGTQNKDTLP